MDGTGVDGTLLAVDGPSLLHRSFHALAGSGMRAPDGRPVWAVKGLLSQLLDAIERVGPDAVVIGFDDTTASLRRQQHPHYKATRAPKPAELVSQLATAVEVLRDLGLCVVVPPGLEADDLCASAAAAARAAGWRCVVLTSDRDSFALVDDTTSVLRLLNGGVGGSPLLTASRLLAATGVAPGQYLDYAALRGDTSDNLAGVRGIGEKTAARLLAALGSAEEAFADAAAGGERVRLACGPAMVKRLADPVSRAAFDVNREIMTMHSDLDVEVDFDGSDGEGRLPLLGAIVEAALDDSGLGLLRSAALRVLTGAAQAAPDRWGVDPYAGLDPFAGLVEPDRGGPPPPPDPGRRPAPPEPVWVLDLF